MQRRKVARVTGLTNSCTDKFWRINNHVENSYTLKKNQSENGSRAQLFAPTLSQQASQLFRQEKIFYALY